MSTTDVFGALFFLPGTKNKCPGSPFACPHPSACAQDPTTGRYFCCDPKSVCWAGRVTCANDGSTFECNSGTKNPWCCTSDAEACTGTTSQINVCWSKLHNVLRDVERATLNETFSSLSAADPEATSWVFNPQTIIAATATTSQTPTSTPSSSSTDSTAAPTTTANNTPAPGSTQAPPTPSSVPSSKSLSGGAIGGIVVGAVAGVVIIALALFFLRRRQNKKKTQYANVPWATMPPKGEQPAAHELSTGKQEPTHELYSGSQPVELPAGEGYRDH
ncbi:hypothetical protein V494_00564 [Pseudogymnoascus sp. VKM F-4513 (FW-928)]|nr:hypothetical protein V494_00564 [Pseudogymnoascus sp. VKM F-4513 (FW-928)]